MDGSVSDYHMELDLKPGLSEQELDARILRDFSEKLNRDFANSLDELLPRSFVPYVVSASGIAPETKVNSVTKEQRAALVKTIKAFELTPAALDPIAESELYLKYNEMTKGKSSVYISHRLASTRFCDRIILIDGGVIKEEGTHEELLALGGKYAELFEIQSKYYREGDGENEKL